MTEAKHHTYHERNEKPDELKPHEVWLEFDPILHRVYLMVDGWYVVGLTEDGMLRRFTDISKHETTLQLDERGRVREV